MLDQLATELNGAAPIYYFSMVLQILCHGLGFGKLENLRPSNTKLLVPSARTIQEYRVETDNSFLRNTRNNERD